MDRRLKNNNDKWKDSEIVPMIGRAIERWKGIYNGDIIEDTVTVSKHIEQLENLMLTRRVLVEKNWSRSSAG